jgi:hypothetical protein
MWFYRLFGCGCDQQVLSDIHRKVTSRALDYSRLNAALEQNEIATDGIKTLLAAVVAELRDIRDSIDFGEMQERLDAFAAQLEANNAEVAEAIIANTLAEEELPPVIVVEEPTPVIEEPPPIIEEPTPEPVVGSPDAA